jgi:hypothetical protein
MPITVKAEDYVRLQRALKDADRKVARAIRKRLREAAGPVGRYVLEYGVEQMPRRGGLQAYLAGHSPVGTSMRSTGVDIWLGSKKKSQLSLINRGFLRHPVWGRSDRTRKQWGWSTQSVPEEAFTEALDHLPVEISVRLRRVVADALKELGL